MLIYRGDYIMDFADYEFGCSKYSLPRTLKLHNDKRNVNIKGEPIKE